MWWMSALVFWPFLQTMHHRGAVLIIGRVPPARVAISSLSPDDICQNPTYEYLSLSHRCRFIKFNWLNSRHRMQAKPTMWTKVNWGCFSLRLANESYWQWLLGRIKKCILFYLLPLSYIKINFEEKQTKIPTQLANGRRLLNVAMWSAIQMTEPKMSCDGCYHIIQVTMEVANADTNVNTNTICLEICRWYKSKYTYNQTQAYSEECCVYVYVIRLNVF